MSDEKRRRRREIRLIQKESVWLQKALFALQKAEDVRESVAELNEEEPEPYTLALEGETLSVGDFEDALGNRVQALLETVQEKRRNLG